MIDLEDFRTKLGLELLGPTTKKQLDINVTDINRPGMQFCGFYEYFAHERVQVIGKVEMTYLESLESRMRRPVLEKYMSYPIPCIITCWGMTPPRDLLEIARAHDVPVFQSKLKTTKFSLQAIMYLNRVLAPHITRHGVLVDVYGVGILLTGISWPPTTWWTSAAWPTTASSANRRRWCATSWRSAASASSTSVPCTAWDRSSSANPSTWSSTWKSGTPPRNTTAWASRRKP